MVQSLAEMRQEYLLAELDEQQVDSDPVRQFQRWLDEAQRAEVPEPNAMTLATVATDGAPSARIVLLKGVDADGFVFYTNYESDKARELAANPRAALVFVWLALQRQVRVTGSVTRTSRQQSEDYFQSRPRGSQIGASVSRQSRVVDSRAELETRFHEAQSKFGEEPIALPDDWGGYCLKPESLEFWQGRRSRLHDRVRYRRTDGDSWLPQRLEP